MQGAEGCAGHFMYFLTMSEQEYIITDQNDSLILTRMCHGTLTNRFDHSPMIKLTHFSISLKTYLLLSMTQYFLVIGFGNISKFKKKIM